MRNYIRYLTKYNIVLKRLGVLFLLLFIINTISAQMLYGTVKNTTNENIVGAYILTENASTMTDTNGHFILTLTDNTTIKISHINYKPYQSTIFHTTKDTIYQDFILNEKVLYLEEVVISDKNSDFYRNIILKSLNKICDVISPNYNYEYKLNHYVRNNAGFTNKFRGEIIINNLGYKKENVKNEEDLLLNKNFKILFKKKEDILLDDKLDEDCGNYCALINNYKGLHTFAATYFWVHFPIIMFKIIRNKEYNFELIYSQDTTTYIIKSYHKNGKIDPYTKVFFLDKRTLLPKRITFFLKDKSAQVGKLIAILMNKDKFIPLPFRVKTKERILEANLFFDQEQEVFLLKEMDIYSFREFNKIYKHNKYLFVEQYANWELKSFLQKESIVNKKVVKSYEDIYKLGLKE